MESLTKPVTENGDCTARRALGGTVPSFPDVEKVLEEIRAGAENALYGAEPEKSEELFAKHVVSLIEGAGLPLLQTMHYRWFLRELARLWRTRTGRDLAFHLELCIRKWVGLGLEPRTLQFLVTEAHERLKAKTLETAKDAKTAEGGDMTGLSDYTDRVPSPDPNDERGAVGQGPLRPNHEEEETTAKDAKTAEGGETPAKTGTVPHAECSEGLSPVFAPDRVPSPESELTTKAPSHQESSGSDTRPLESSNPGILP